MHPLAMFLLAIFSPLLLAMTLFVPPYAGIVAASYIIYAKTGVAAHPLAGKLGDVFYMIDVYRNLFVQWSGHIMESDVLSYSLPLILPPLLGITLMLWLTNLLARKLMDVFQLGVGH